MANDMRKIERVLRQSGFVAIRKSGSHTIWRHPDGRQCVTAETSADRRGLLNLRRDLRKIGVEV